MEWSEQMLTTLQKEFATTEDFGSLADRLGVKQSALLSKARSLHLNSYQDNRVAKKSPEPAGEFQITAQEKKLLDLMASIMAKSIIRRSGEQMAVSLSDHHEHIN